MTAAAADDDAAAAYAKRWLLIDCVQASVPRQEKAAAFSERELCGLCGVSSKVIGCLLD